MSTIEEHSHQLFTSLLKASRNYESFDFEGLKYATGTGPKFTSSDGTTFFDFTGQNGLLGYGHPLSFKINLIRLLNDRIPKDDTGQKKECESLLSKLIGQNIFITYPQKDAENLFAGRSCEFLSKKLSDNHYNLVGLFSKPIGISFVEKDYREDMTEILMTLNFLTKGQFYGKNGLIRQRQTQLEQAFNSLNSVKRIDGLEVELETESLPEHFLLYCHSPNLMRFPLSFNDDLLREITSFMD